MLLADEFFLLSHEDTTGKPRLNARASGLGLAAGLLAELILRDRLTVEDAKLTIVDRNPPPDALSHTVLDQLIGEPGHRAVRVWLDFLGQHAYDWVAERLARSGVLRRETSRRMLRATTVYKPVDMNVAAGPAARLRARLARGEPLVTSDAALVGLVAATDLTRSALWNADSQTEQRVPQVVATLPPPLHELVRHLQAAVGAAVLSPRR